jgi:hypothetical protein
VKIPIFSSTHFMEHNLKKAHRLKLIPSIFAQLYVLKISFHKIDIFSLWTCKRI